MSSFIAAMDTTTHMKTGVNGSDVYDMPVGKQQELLALFGALNRDLEKDKLVSLMEATKLTASLEDMAVLAFHTRDILEGKGERDLFYTMFHELYKTHPDALFRTMKEIPNFGAWFDLQKLISHGIKNNYITSSIPRKSDSDYQLMKAFKNEPIVQKVIQLYGEQLLEDSNKENNFTLAAKWLPREGKRNGWINLLVAQHLFPSEFAINQGFALKKLRQMVSAINTKLNTIEMKMCHDAEGKHHFSDIDPAHVPSRCLKMKRKAFFNENKDGTIRNEDDMDRMFCRNRFLEHIQKAVKGEASVHGRRLMPHEFIIALENRTTTQTDRDTLQAQWNDLRQSILEKGTLGKTVVMCDFSGSMESGGHGSVRPIDVSKGLGLLCSECTSPAFRDRMITFDSNPTWHNVSKYTSLNDRIQSFRGVSQGTSTNFQAAVDLILRRLVEARVPVGEEPDVLLVLTDMGWDQANNNSHYSYYNRSVDTNKFETHITRIQEQFKSSGGWKVPTIVIWNISGKFQEYHHESNTPGTCTISGWSPTILKYILEGENIMEKLEHMTPYNMMREVLDDERYNIIRELVRDE